MTELNLHALAIEFCRINPGADVTTVEAAMNAGAIAATEHATRVIRETRAAINAQWRQNQHPLNPQPSTLNPAS